MEVTNESLMEQSNVLKEIRDEIRSSRTTNPFTGAVGGVGRPQNTFVQSQMFMDRVVSGEWANMGWANAYTSRFNSSWKTDLTGAMGFGRSTNSMTQLEFQHVALQSLDNRVSRFMGGMISPYYTGVTQHLGQDIFENSQRFARFGDAQTSVLGSGLSFGGSQALARKVTNLSFRDMRMSAEDYGDVVSVGLKMSQYDHVKTNDEFVKKTKELAAAVGDLTRTMHMSVKEISESMGAMRQFGIVDVADQRRTMMRLQASSQIGGFTTGQGIEAWSHAAQMGTQLGVAAQVAGQVGVDNLMRTREMSRTGIIPQYLMGLGGGAEGISRSITDAQLKHLSSTAGYLQYLGGGGGTGDRNAMFDMMKGLGAAGSVDSILSMQARKMEFLEKAKDDPDKVNRAYTQSIENKIRMMTGQQNFDMGSEGARDRAYAMVRGDMGDAAGLAFANTNFTRAGRMTRDGVSWRAAMAADVQQNKLDYDTWSLNNTTAGRVHSALKEVRSIPGQVADWGMGLWEGNGQYGMTQWGSPMTANMQAHNLGAKPDNVAPEDLLKTLTYQQTTYRDPKVLEFDLGTRPAAMGAAFGKGFGAVAGGLLGSLIPIPVVGTLAGAWLGSYLGEMGGAFLGSQIDQEKLQLKDDPTRGTYDATNYIKSIDQFNMSKKVNSEDRRNAYTKLMNDSEWFRKQVLFGSGDSLRGTSSQVFAERTKSLARYYDLKPEQVWAAFEEGGVDRTPELGHRGLLNEELLTQEKMNSVIGGVILKDTSSIKGVDFANSANAAALRDLITPLRTQKDDVEFALMKEGPEKTALLKSRFEEDDRRARSQRTLAALGMNEKDMRKIQDNAGIDTNTGQFKQGKAIGGGGDLYDIGETSMAKNKQALDILNAHIDAGALRQRNNIFKTGMTVARGLLSGDDTDIGMRSEFEEKFGKTGDLLGVLQSKDAKLKERLSSRSEVFKQAFDIQGMDLKQLLALQPNQMGLGRDQIEKLRQAIENYQEPMGPFPEGQSPLTKQQFARNAFATFVMANPGATQELRSSKAESEARLFERATLILDKLAEKLELVKDAKK